MAPSMVSDRRSSGSSDPGISPNCSSQQSKRDGSVNNTVPSISPLGIAEYRIPVMQTLSVRHTASNLCAQSQLPSAAGWTRQIMFCSSDHCKLACLNIWEFLNPIKTALHVLLLVLSDCWQFRSVGPTSHVVCRVHDVYVMVACRAPCTNHVRAVDGDTSD